MDTRDSEFSLIRRAQGGDREALGNLFRSFRPSLKAIAGKLLGKRLEREIALEDVLQETCSRACSSIGEFRWQGEGSFLRWLSCFARNVILEAAKKLGKAPAAIGWPDPVADDTSPSRGLRREERFDRLKAAIDRLSPIHRQVILLARIEKLPLKEVAARMDRSHDGVRQLLRRALAELREGFGDTESLGLPPRKLEEGEGDVR